MGESSASSLTPKLWMSGETRKGAADPLQRVSVPFAPLLQSKPLDVGIQLDGGGSPDFNSGFFQRGVMQGEDGVGGREVKVGSGSTSPPLLSPPVLSSPLLTLLSLPCSLFPGHRKRPRPHR